MSALPSLGSIPEAKLPTLTGVSSLNIPSLESLSSLRLEDLRNIKLPNIASLGSGMTKDEAKTVGAVALGVVASGAVVVLVCKSKANSYGFEILTLEDLEKVHDGGLAGTLFSWVATPPTTIIRVSGHGYKLTALPRGITSMVRLKELNLSNNALTELPSGIGKLRALENLDLGGNKLMAVPEEIGGLTALTALNLMGNELESLPDSLGALTGLIRLGLKGNKLTSLPVTIGNLKQMKEIFLTDNLLESLPEEIGDCTALVKVQASHNALRSLPASLGSLKNLELLRVACCEITEIPKAVAAGPALAWLSLATNPACKGPANRKPRVPTITMKELKVGRKLGDGASGEVFAATWKGRRVALKLFRADRSPDGHSADEIGIACALSEKHLIKVLAKLDSPLGLVMEYVEGAPLAEKPNSQSLLRCRWAEGVTFKLPFVLNVAVGIASALEAMHARGLVHGDVYAHNILADKSGNSVLCDYGAAFYYPKALAKSFEGHEARGFGLLLRDLVTRLDIGFEGMSAALDAQKKMLMLVQQCTLGPPARRPKMASIAQKLKALQESSSTAAFTAAPTPSRARK